MLVRNAWRASFCLRAFGDGRWVCHGCERELTLPLLEPLKGAVKEARSDRRTWFSLGGCAPRRTLILAMGGRTRAGIITIGRSKNCVGRQLTERTATESFAADTPESSGPGGKAFDSTIMRSTSKYEDVMGNCPPQGRIRIVVTKMKGNRLPPREPETSVAFFVQAADHRGDTARRFSCCWRNPGGVPSSRPERART